MTMTLTRKVPTSATPGAPTALLTEIAALTGFHSFYVADDSYITEAATLISAWARAAGSNGGWSQATGAKQPVFTQRDGMDVARFDGNKVLGWTGDDLSANATMWWAAKWWQSAPTTDNQFILGKNTSPAFKVTSMFTDDNGQFIRYFYSDGAVFFDSDFMPLNGSVEADGGTEGWVQAIWSQKSGAAYLCVKGGGFEGQIWDNATGGVPSVETMFTGGISDASPSFQGDIRALAVGTGDLFNDLAEVRDLMAMLDEV